MSMTPPGAQQGQLGGAPPSLGPQAGQQMPQLAQMAQAFAPALGGSGLSPSFIDLSTKMDNGWQLLDASKRNITAALNSGTFYKNPPVLAAVRQIEEDLGKLIATYARGQNDRRASIEAPMVSNTGATDDGDDSEDGDETPEDSGAD